MDFDNIYGYKIIYIFKINDNKHKGILKIGDATLHTDLAPNELLPNSDILVEAAKKRIDSYTKTAGIAYDLLWTELAIRKCQGEYQIFRDHEVHNVLKNSGISLRKMDGAKEWFETDLNTAKNAIKAVKEYKKTLSGKDITFVEPIEFREEQLECIEKAVKHFEKSNQFLINAKMRYGKTLVALEIIKQCNFSKTIIFTHRPVVDAGWHEDFNKIFNGLDYIYASKEAYKVAELVKQEKSFIYFASIQDLRGSERIGGIYKKNEDIFDINWDCVIIDEAHEGTETDLGQKVIDAVIKDNTKFLALSGTPFNILQKYEEKEIFTWDYIAEQERKLEWNLTHFGDYNPYDELPEMKIFTYSLGRLLGNKYIDIEDKAFNFKEFFRVYTGEIEKDYCPIPAGSKIGDFVHEKDIKKFLDLMAEENSGSLYPFANEEYRNLFKHTLWVVPGVKEAKALQLLMYKHAVFGNGQFNIVNVAGDGDEEMTDALKYVKDAIKKAEKDDTYTITLSCGKLTVGVTVREWTGVLLLAGSNSTSAANYLQTIFRVQSPCNKNGKFKERAYVFDFAPDRTLKMVSAAVAASVKAGKTSVDDKNRLGKFLNFCPVIGYDGSKMEEYSVPKLLRQLKRAYAEKVANNGFDDISLYNEDAFLTANSGDREDFADLQAIIGKTKKEKGNPITINAQGMDSAEIEEAENTEEKEKGKGKESLTPEEEEKLRKLRELKKERATMISILRGLSVRMPLLIFGADFPYDTDITLSKFIELVDDKSWEEFMPKGVTKEKFKKFEKYYDEEIFVSAGLKIRAVAMAADNLEPTERVMKIATLFSKFKNPDKETVLTPWNVVNLHLSETIGGWDFFDDSHEINKMLTEPRFVSPKLAPHIPYTEKLFNNENSKILEINSKTGLYPLYIAYSCYRAKLENLKSSDISLKEKQKIWDDIIKNNIYVICKTKMAKSITQRTLLGYRNKSFNHHTFDNMLNQMQNKPEKLKEKLLKGDFWKKEEKEMKFDAIVGNPPYQGESHQQIYTDFYLTARNIGESVSLIFPTGWQEPKTANNLGKLNKAEIKKDKQIVCIDNRQNVFPGIAGAEWTNIILWQKGYDNELGGKQLIYTDGANPKEVQLLCSKADIKKPIEIEKLAKLVTESENFKSLSTETTSRNPYGLSTDAIKDAKKYGLEPFQNEKILEDDLKVYAKNDIKFVPKDYKLPKENEILYKYKVFVPYAWGNMSEKSGLGGAFSDIIIGLPSELCTETYLISGCFDDYITAKKHAKYLMTKFCRALLYVNKFSHHSTTAWGAIPVQDYSEEWWDESIEKIDEHLFDKYDIPKEIRDFVKKNIQPRSEKNIINFYKK